MFTASESKPNNSGSGNKFRIRIYHSVVRAAYTGIYNCYIILAGKPCGIDYEMKAYVGDTVEDKPHKRNSVRLAIRKVPLPTSSTRLGHTFFFSKRILRSEPRKPSWPASGAAVAHAP